MLTFMTVQEISNKKHNIKKYIVIKMYFFLKKNHVCIKQEFHVVNNFTVNMLININIFNLEQININVSNKILIINIYNSINVFISINIKSKSIQTLIFNKSLITISMYIVLIINIIDINFKLKLFNNKDFFFESNSLNNLKIYIHIIDADIKNVLI